MNIYRGRAGASLESSPTPDAHATRTHSADCGMAIRLYVASASGSLAVKKRQQDVIGFLEANRISFEEIDITMLEDQRLWMYKNIPENKQPEKGNPLPPQIFNGTVYCGDYEDFFLSKEVNTVFSFLGLNSQALGKDAKSEAV